MPGLVVTKEKDVTYNPQKAVSIFAFLGYRNSCPLLC